MAARSKSDKQKDIDDILLSIDSLLDTAIDIDSQGLITPERESDGKPEKTAYTKVHSEDIAAKKETTTTPTVKTRKTTPSKKQIVKKKPDTRIDYDDKQNSDKKTESKPGEKVSKPELTLEKGNTKIEKADSQASESKSSSSLNFSPVSDDLTQALKELPVLDDIITSEDLALIGAGKELPKSFITKKFHQKTTTDKLIDLLTIHLSDYNITRLQYGYLHELIDELLKDEDKKL